MKAITVWNPWAFFLANNMKLNETRGHKINYRGEIAIHSALKVVGKGYIDTINESFRKHGIRNDDVLTLEGKNMYYNYINGDKEKLVFGAVLATANVVDCIEITPAYIIDLINQGRSQEIILGDYTYGRYAWVLEDVKKLDEPIFVKGQQGMWNFDI